MRQRHKNGTVERLTIASHNGGVCHRRRGRRGRRGVRRRMGDGEERKKQGFGRERHENAVLNKYWVFVPHCAAFLSGVDRAVSAAPPYMEICLGSTAMASLSAQEMRSKRLTSPSRCPVEKLFILFYPCTEIFDPRLSVQPIRFPGAPRLPTPLACQPDFPHNTPSHTLQTPPTASTARGSPSFDGRFLPHVPFILQRHALSEGLLLPHNRFAKP